MSKTPNEQMLERLEGYERQKFEAELEAERTRERLRNVDEILKRIDFKKLGQAIDQAVSQEKARNDQRRPKS